LREPRKPPSSRHLLSYPVVKSREMAPLSAVQRVFPFDPAVIRSWPVARSSEHEREDEGGGNRAIYDQVARSACGPPRGGCPKASNSGNPERETVAACSDLTVDEWAPAIARRYSVKNRTFIAALPRRCRRPFGLDPTTLAPSAGPRLSAPGSSSLRGHLGPIARDRYTLLLRLLRC
jgi:hypothetical protein